MLGSITILGKMKVIVILEWVLQEIKAKRRYSKDRNRTQTILKSLETLFRRWVIQRQEMDTYRMKYHW